MNATKPTARPKAAARHSAPSPATRAPIREIDQLLRPIACNISVILRPLVDAWPFGNGFPGQSAIQKADGVLQDLSKDESEWENDQRERPITSRMLENLKHHLSEALDQIESADDVAPGQRRLLLLLVREAVAQDKALGSAFGEACLAQRFGSLRDLAQGAGGKPLTRDTFEINPSTPLLQAGKTAENMAIWCTYDIETLSDEVTLLGDDCDYEGATSIGAKLRCFGARINSLNSVVMSYLTREDGLTIGEVNTAYYGGAKPFNAQETTHA